MGQFKFFIANELPQELQKALMTHNIISMHASSMGIKTTSQAQINFCFSHNMIMVTMNGEIIKLCDDLSHPVFHVKEHSIIEDVVKQILLYVNERVNTIVSLRHSQSHLRV